MGKSIAGRVHSNTNALRQGCGVHLRGSKEVGVAGAERIRVILVGGGGQRESGGQIA